MLPGGWGAGPGLGLLERAAEGTVAIPASPPASSTSGPVMMVRAGSGLLSGAFGVLLSLL